MKSGTRVSLVQCPSPEVSSVPGTQEYSKMIINLELELNRKMR